MTPLTKNGRAATEVTTPPGVDGKGGILTGDRDNLHLVLVRVQAHETARRGRGLVRFITDLEQRVDKPIPVVAECPHRCGRFYNVEVDLSDASDPIVLRLPDNCPRCGASLQEYTMIRDLVGTARYFAETATRGRAS